MTAPGTLSYDIPFRVLGWTILWYSFYKSTFHLFTGRTNEHNCRIITLIHAISITLSSAYVSFFNGTNPFNVIGFPNTHIQLLVLSASLGYFLFDFAWCLYHQTEGYIMLLHHVISIVFMSVCLYLGVSGTETVATIFGSEITSIVLNIRWFFKHYNLYHGKLGIFTDVLFFGMFLGVRLGVGGYLNYRVLISEKSPLLIKTGGFFFYLVNCLFFIQMISFLRYRIRTWNQKPPKKTVSYQNGHTSHNSIVNGQKNGFKKTQ